MPLDVDRRIAELLCSRICHELVAGIAAINNGVELINEIDASMFDEAMGLIGDSARQSSARVQYYRMSYGFAGNDALNGIGPVRELVDGLVETEDRFAVNVADPAPDMEMQPGWGKLLLNLIVFAMDCLPKGGTVTTSVEMHDGRPRLGVLGQGEEARLSDRYRAAIEAAGPDEEVTALNVHAYYTAALAAELGNGLQPDVTNGSISIRVTF